jgi:hypothetical protein
MADEPADAGQGPEPGEEHDESDDSLLTRDSRPEPPSDERALPSAPNPQHGSFWSRSPRSVRLAFAGAALCAIIALDVFFMMRAPSSDGAALTKSTPNPGGVVEPAKPGPATPTNPALQVAPSPSSEKGETLLPEFDADSADTADASPSPAKARPRKHFATVHEASVGSCSTASVDGLSRQIVEQTRCISPRAFAPLPSRANLVMDPHVFPFLEIGARDHLVRVLDAHRDSVMTINSALRTVAQQYLAWRWGAGKRCGVTLATSPGESNHETGLAIDIADEARWRQALEAEDFRWLGSSDKVHFDYAGNGTSTRRNMDVLAFQQLWNKNHPDDTIAANGKYTSATEQRLKKAPPDGFPIGPNCGKARSRR